MNKFSGSSFTYSEAGCNNNQQASKKASAGGGCEDRSREKSMTNCCFKTKQRGRTCKLRKHNHSSKKVNSLGSVCGGDVNVNDLEIA